MREAIRASEAEATTAARAARARSHARASASSDDLERARRDAHRLREEAILAEQRAEFASLAADHSRRQYEHVAWEMAANEWAEARRRIPRRGRSRDAARHPKSSTRASSDGSWTEDDHELARALARASSRTRRAAEARNPSYPGTHSLGTHPQGTPSPGTPRGHPRTGRRIPDDSDDALGAPGVAFRRRRGGADRRGDTPQPGGGQPGGGVAPKRDRVPITAESRVPITRSPPAPNHRRRPFVPARARVRRIFAWNSTRARASARARTETSLAPRFAEPSSAPTNANARPNRNRLLLRPGDRRTKTSRRLPARVDQSSTTRARRFSRRNVARDWRWRRRRVDRRRRRVSSARTRGAREEARREREEARVREREEARVRERERRMERKRRSEAAEAARQSEEAAERVERESAARRAASDVGAMDLPDALRAVGFAPTDATDPVAVRKAYKRAALRFHPDRTRSASLADRVAGEEVWKLLGSKMEAYAAATRDGR